MEQIIQNWNDILAQMQSEFDISDVKLKVYRFFDLTLFRESSPHKNLSLLKLENNLAYFVIPDDLKQLKTNYESKYATALHFSILFATDLKLDGVKFITPDEVSINKKEAVTETFPINNRKPFSNPSAHANLNSKYTFDTYVVGENNSMAVSSCLAVAETPGEVYNPLFLYGGPGLGKTHLMTAIAHFIIDNIPDKKVLLVNTNDFTNEIVTNLRNTNVRNDVVSNMNHFREKYANLDVLLIDDIQFIEGKDHTIQEVFYIFNKLYESGKQIVISSDRPPRELKDLDERLISRFNMGVTTDISSPSYETRKAILQKKNELEHYFIDDSILNYIAKNITANVRDLEGGLKKMVAFSKLYNKKPTLEDAEKELRYLIFPDNQLNLTADFIIETVAGHFNLTVNDLVSSSREKSLVTARRIAMYLCREHIKEMTYKDIGTAFGGKDHSTCLTGIKKIEKEYINQIGDTRTIIDTLTKQIKPNDT